MRRLFLAYFGLAVLAVTVGGGAEVDWSTENKESYCDMISRRRIYRQQRLDDDCQLKVQEVDGQVCFSKFNIMAFFVIWSFDGV